MLLVPSLAHGLGARQEQAVQPESLRIVVIEGEDSVNIIGQGPAVPTVVEVRDRNDLPVSGASVVFLLGEGGTATLNAGLSQVALTTNALGQAAVTVNPVASGAVQLSVIATFQGQAAATTIVQTNAASAAADAGAGGGAAGAGLGTGAIVGIVGGAVGAGLGVRQAVAGGDSSPSAASAPSLTAGDGQLGVSWTAPSDNGAAIDDYDVRYRTGGGSWTELPDAVKSTSTTATITGLTNGTAYEVQVRAGNSVGDGAWSASATGTPVAAAAVPSAPSAPSLTAGDGQLGVSWTAPSDNGAAIDDYDLRYRTGGGSWTELPDAVKSTSTTATITGLTNGTAYEVQVRAGNSVGDGAWSASATGTPVAAAAVPSAPSAPSLTAGDGQLGVSWTAPSDNGAAIDDYDLRYRTGGGSWTELPDAVKSTSTTATITGLTNGTAYEVQVRAGNSVGDGAWSASATGTPVAAAAVPSAPSAPSLTAGDGQLGVSWTAPSDNGAAIDDYDVRYRTGGGSWTELPDAVKSTSTTATITGLTNGTTYEVQVRAGNSVGDGAWSASATGTPVATAVPSAPSAPSLTAGDGQLGVSWTAPSDNGAAIDDYDLRYRTGGGSWTELPDAVKSTSTTATITGLTNGTAYEVQVRAGNSVGDGAWSASATGTPVAAAAVPSAPSAPSLTAGDGQLGVSWTAPSDNGAAIDDYDLRYRPAGGSWTELPDAVKSTSTTATITGLTNGTANEVQVRAGNSVGDGEWSASATGTPAAATSEDRAALVEFYNATNGANWGNNTNWNSSAPLDQWYGVFTNANGRVTDLDLDTNGLTGSIPSSLGSLTNLAWLDLSNNQLTGSIPSSLGSLTNLTHLWLNGNQLTGSIPAALCRFESIINPQQGGVDLPCSESDTVDALEARLVSGDGQLTVDWTAPSGDGEAVDDYDVRYRADAETGAWTELPDAAESAAPSATITGLTNGTAYQVQVRAGDGEWSATVTGTPAAPAERLTFGEARIEDQRFRQHAAIAPLVLPAATGGEGLLNYALSPALPAGLVFDAATRTLSGAPSVATAASTWTYTVTDGAASPEQVSLSFAIEVEVSAEEAALRRDALAAQGRALLSSVTGVIGERFRPRQAAGLEVGGGARGAGRALGEALASMFGSWSSQGRVGGAGGAAFAPGVGTAGHAARVGGGRLDGLSGVGGASGFVGPSAAGSDVGLGGLSASGWRLFDGALPGIGGGGWDGGLWGRSFAAPLATGEDGVGASRYTVWGAGDRQSFSGAPEQGRYSGDVRSLYVGADRRLGADWLAGAAVGRSWGAADYAANAAAGVEGRLTTRLTSLYPYVRGAVSSGLELWAIGGYGRGEAGDAQGMEALGAPADLTMTMGAAGLRQDVAERGGVALAVVGGAGSLSLSTAGGGLTLAGLGAGVHQARVAVEASRASGAVSPFVQVGGRYDGGDGQTGGGLEVVAGLRASTSRIDLEARGRWLSLHSASGYEEYGATVRLAVKSRPDGTGLRAVLAPRWGAADELAVGEDGLLGGAGMSSLQRGAAWTPPGQALSLDGELGYGWRTRRLRGVLSPMTSYRRTGFGGDLTQVGFTYLPSQETLRGDLRMQFTLGREQWLEQGAGYRLALTLLSAF